jgi:hypothetical protein
MGLGWIVHWGDAQHDHDLLLARAVRTLPAGTEASWFSYVDRQFASAIEPDGDALKVAATGDHILGKTTFVSRNSPYQIDCDPALGVTVSFGTGDDAIMVPIYGVLRVELKDTKPPALGVDPESVAAAKVTDQLCQRVAARMQATMGTVPKQAMQ